jgi:thiol-disulfide isomerase/thioredoxin
VEAATGLLPCPLLNSESSMLKSLLFLASLLLASTQAFAQSPAAPTLKVGDAAPALTVKQWVKGEAVSGFAKDKVYVVEFWATWCGPCKASIPHLTELQKKFKDVSFIGVAVFERDPEQSKVVGFVEKMGEKMVYHVAMDDVPEGKKNNEGAMAKNWMIASGAQGIPTAFIVGKDGHIAWMGHPTVEDKMEAALEKVIAGKYDLAAYEKEQAEEAALEAARQELGQKLNELMQGQDTKGALAAIDAAIVKTPKLESTFGTYKFKFMLDTKDYTGGYAYGAKLASGLLKDDPQGQYFIAGSITDPEAKYETVDLKLALKCAQRANELTKSEEPMVLDLLAKVEFANGDSAKAVEFQTKAVELVKGSKNEKEFQGRLDEYKAGKPAAK